MKRYVCLHCGKEIPENEVHELNGRLEHFSSYPSRHKATGLGVVVLEYPDLPTENVWVCGRCKKIISEREIDDIYEVAEHKVCKSALVFRVSLPVRSVPVRLTAEEIERRFFLLSESRIIRHKLEEIDRLRAENKSLLDELAQLKGEAGISEIQHLRAENVSLADRLALAVHETEHIRDIVKRLPERLCNTEREAGDHPLNLDEMVETINPIIDDLERKGAAGL